MDCRSAMVALLLVLAGASAMQLDSPQTFFVRRPAIPLIYPPPPAAFLPERIVVPPRFVELCREYKEGTLVAPGFYPSLPLICENLYLPNDPYEPW